jgi:hypothetical protein
MPDPLKLFRLHNQVGIAHAPEQGRVIEVAGGDDVEAILRGEGVLLYECLTTEGMKRRRT